MDQRAFTKAVTNWETETIATALAKDPALARHIDDIGKTPLHHCAEQNPNKPGLKANESIKTTEALLAAGADVNAIRIIMDDGEEFRASPLWYAVAWGKNYQLARFLLANGARVDDNAMGAAIWDQDLRMAELLRLNGGNIDHVFRGETPLLRTVKARRFLLLKWLVDNGANINFQDSEGYTALYHATKRDHTLAQVNELMSYGARSNLRALDGSTAISLAEAKKKSRLVKLLKSF